MGRIRDGDRDVDCVATPNYVSRVALLRSKLIGGW